MLAPICLFTYNRLSETIKTVNALKANYLATESDLIIFSDAPKSSDVRFKVKNVRDFLKTVTGFKSVKIINSDINRGLADSIIKGVTEVISSYGKVIVLEDDLITSKNFLNYMNDALDFYKDNISVFSIAGYTPPIHTSNHDVYFTKRASSWGWATWDDRWTQIEWDLENYKSLFNTKTFKKDFNRMGSDMFKMLNDQRRGKINSWAIRWCLHQFVKDTFTVYPTISKIQNIGTGLEATHTKDNFNRFYTELDPGFNINFSFSTQVYINSFYLTQFLTQFSVYTRLKFKILNMFS